MEFYRDGVYPTKGMNNLTDQTDPTDYSKYEIVDKIIYINPTAPNTVRLTPQAFRIEQDYTYDYVDHDGNTKALGDHRPVVVTFKYQLSGNTTPTAITLADAADNTTAISNADGVLADVTLQGRKLVKNGTWNTLCLPFSMTADQVSAQLAPAALMELDIEGTYSGHKTGLDGTTLYLYFKNADAITAGKPYIIKWAAGEKQEDPVFRSVTVSSGSPAEVKSIDASVTFQGTYAPASLAKDDPSNLYLGSDSRLYYPGRDGFYVNAFRGYFLLSEAATNARQFVLNIGEDTATSVDSLQFTVDRGDAVVYDLQGRRVSNALKPGIYIRNGRKLIVK